MDYDAYLLSTKWKAVRAWAMQRASGQCQGHVPPFHALYGGFRCSNKRRLQVHHLTYERLGAELPEDVVVLCGRCHAITHLRQVKCVRCGDDVYPLLTMAFEHYEEYPTATIVTADCLCRGCAEKFKE